MGVGSIRPDELVQLPLHALSVFERVARCRSMTAAARHIHVTPGAVSRQIRMLEDALGCALFRRDWHELRLSAAGEALYPYVQQALAAACTGLQRARNAGRLARVRLYAWWPMSHYWLRARVGELQQTLPCAEVDMLAGPSPVEGGLCDADLAVSVASLDPRMGLCVRPEDGLFVQQLVTLVRVPAGSIALLERYGRPTCGDELARFPLAAIADELPCWEAWMTLAGVRRPERIMGRVEVVSSLAAMLDLAHSGAAITFGVRGLSCDAEPGAASAEGVVSAIRACAGVRQALWVACRESALLRSEVRAALGWLRDHAPSIVDS